MIEYKVVLYNKNTNLEEYEYFDDKEEALNYAKEMKDINTITSVYEYDDEYGEGQIYVSEV